MSASPITAPRCASDLADVPVGARLAERAPLIAPACALTLGIAASHAFGAAQPRLAGLAAAAALLALGTLTFMAATRRNGNALSTIALVAGVFAAGFARHQAAIDLPEHHVGRLARDAPVLARLMGTMVSAPHTRPGERRNAFLPYSPPPRTSFVVEATRIESPNGWVDVCGLVRVGVDAQTEALERGRKVELTGWLYRPIPRRNPGERDWARWSRLQGIYAALSVEHAEHARALNEAGGGVTPYVESLRAAARSALIDPAAHHEESSGVLDSMALGQRSAVSRTVDEAFARTGAIHFLSASGFHVAVLAGACWQFARVALRGGRQTAAWLTIGVIAVYAFALAEPNAPILRAGIMGILACGSVILRRPLSGLNWLALSALILLSLNPQELFRPGFQLSFLMMIVLIEVVPRVLAALNRREANGLPPPDADSLPALVLRILSRGVLGLLVTCALCWLVALPLTWLHFERIAPLGALQSAAITPLATLVIVMGFLTTAAGLLVAPLGALLIAPTHTLAEGLLWLVQRLARFPGSSVEMPPPAAWQVAATYGLLFAGCWMAWSRTASRSVSARRVCGALIVAAATGVWGGPALHDAARDRPYALHVLDVGDGSAAALVAPCGKTLILDVGTMHNFDAGRTMVQALNAIGARGPVALSISHANTDHFSGVPTVLESLDVQALLTTGPLVAAGADSPSVRRLLDVVASRLPPRPLARGDRLTLGEAVIEVLWPEQAVDASLAANDASLVSLVRVRGSRLLLTGDVEREGIRGLLRLHEAGEIDLLADVMVAPHHGSVEPGDTEALLAAVDPQWIVASTRQDRPALRACAGATLGDGVRVLTTAESGAIELRALPGGHVETVLRFATPRE